MNPYNGPVKIVENFKVIHKSNPISGHLWTEQGDTIGWEVIGGGWMRTSHKTLKAAEKEAQWRREFPMNC